MAKIAHIYGTLRSVEPATKSGTNEVWGSRASILSEPKGDSFDVVAFAREHSPRELQALEGTDVHAIVDVDVTAGVRGAFLNCILRQIEPWHAPVSGGAPAFATAVNETVRV